MFYSFFLTNRIQTKELLKIGFPNNLIFPQYPFILETAQIINGGSIKSSTT